MFILEMTNGVFEGESSNDLQKQLAEFMFERDLTVLEAEKIKRVYEIDEDGETAMTVNPEGLELFKQRVIGEYAVLLDGLADYRKMTGRA